MSLSKYALKKAQQELVSAYPSPTKSQKVLAKYSAEDQKTIIDHPATIASLEVRRKELQG